MTLPIDWLVPDWPAPANVRSVFTTRSGGVSTGPYASLNLGDHVGDDAAAVQTNRARLAEVLGATPVYLQQVHGSGVVRLPITPTSPNAAPVQADACFTTERGPACTIMVADCLPVLFTNRSGTVVAAAHAGWRGLVGLPGEGGVLESSFKQIMAATQAADAPDASQFIAWLGPCIGPARFEVGDEVRSAFVAQQAQASALFQAHGPGKWLADLPGLARQRLAAMGISSVYGNNGSTDWCTVDQASSFFSYRRERVSGRMAACIWLG
ncbi:peptidoglycan editing factor PgeF [Variovorax sp. HJSM1_2]|uniref:peptidoglycan editing factor PgeF n=1 Tax=Variovorax sp. HJSM1_2 TaxID=3366263 RepID=UPI003BC4264E